MLHIWTDMYLYINSVDPDQTAPQDQSVLSLLCLPEFYETSPSLKNGIVKP